MSLVLQSSGGGQITIQEPATASNFTQTLPAADGTIVTTESPQSGSVIQVVNATYAVQVSSTSTSFVTTGLTATITPKFATSRIYVICNTSAANSSSTNASGYTVFRGTVSGTNLGDATAGIIQIYNGSSQVRSGVSISLLDSPATTSATTYTLAMNTGAGSTAFAQQDNRPANMTLMEIAV